MRFGDSMPSLMVPKWIRSDIITRPISTVVDDTPAAHGMSSDSSRSQAASKERKNSSKTESRHRAAHFLDDANLVRAHLFQDHFESCLFFRGSRGCAACAC